MTTKQKGDAGEVIAIKYLQGKGFKILDTNYKFGRFGEIDVIVKKERQTHFIEVKYRESEKYGTPEESITKSKLYKLQKSIFSYCMKNKVDYEKIQFDVITIIRGKESYKLKHYKNLEI